MLMARLTFLEKYYPFRTHNTYFLPLNDPQNDRILKFLYQIGYGIGALIRNTYIMIGQY